MAEEFAERFAQESLHCTHHTLLAFASVGRVAYDVMLRAALTRPNSRSSPLPSASRHRQANQAHCSHSGNQKTTMLWQDSGCGAQCSMSLQDAEQLAVDAGFTFKGDDSTRADLQSE